MYIYIYIIKIKVKIVLFFLLTNDKCMQPRCIRIPICGPFLAGTVFFVFRDLESANSTSTSDITQTVEG